MPSPFKSNKKARRRARKGAAKLQAAAAEIQVDHPEIAASVKRFADSYLRIGQAKRKRREAQ
jgi:hypothetical protein